MSDYISPGAPSHMTQAKLLFLIPFKSKSDQKIATNGKARYTPKILVEQPPNPTLKTWLEANHPELEALIVHFCVAESFAGQGFTRDMEHDVNDSVKALVDLVGETEIFVNMCAPENNTEFEKDDFKTLANVQNKIKERFENEATKAKKSTDHVRFQEVPKKAKKSKVRFDA